jgi:hypothetical protein
MAEIEGLNRWEWRRRDDGTPQRKDKERIDATYGSLDTSDPRELARKLVEFADKHDDAKVDLEHKYEDHHDYSCEYWIELTGWTTVTEATVQAEARRHKAQLRREAEHEQRLLERRLEESRRRMEGL